MVNRVKVLAHAGAPSTFKDDARYKAQALAYLDFQGFQAFTITDKEQVQQNTPAVASDCHDDHVTESIQKGRASFAIPLDVTRLDETTLPLPNSLAYLDDTQLGYTALESQLLTSSLITPAARSHKRRASAKSAFSEALATSSVQETPPETFQGQNDTDEQTPSSYLRSPELNQSSKKPRLIDKLRDERAGLAPAELSGSPPKALEQQVSSPSHAPPDKLKSDSASGERFLPHHDAREVQDPSIDMNSELPTTYSLSDISTRSPRSLLRSQQRSTSDPTALPSPPRKQRRSQVSLPASQPVANNNAGAPIPRHVPLTSRDASKEAAHHPVRDKANASARIERDIESDLVQTARHVAKEERNISTIKPINAFNSSTEPTKRRTPCEHDDAQGQTINTAKPALAPPKSPRHSTASPTPQHPKPVPKTAPPPQPPRPTLPTNQIHPLPPTPQTTPFTTHLTPALSFLKTPASQISTKYAPLTQTRPLEPLERGHWLLSTGSWGGEVQHKCWKFLQAFIGDGRAGWGVWCEREAGGYTGEEGGEGEIRGGEGEVLRVWCWGEVIEEVWLVLYVASMSKVRRAGARWVDSDGVGVVVMP